MPSSINPTAVPRQARRATAIWQQLATPTISNTTFAPDAVAALPTPIRRWLTSAITPGTPLATSVILQMRGRILIGTWRSFTATQVLAAGRGYIWAATARIGPIPVHGYDRYNDAQGEMRWRLGGLIPVMSAADTNITRSAAGRLAAETVLLPAALLATDIRWEPVDDISARAHLPIAGETHSLTIGIADDDSLACVELPRWGPLEEGGHGPRAFGVRCSGTLTSSGYQLPRQITAGWDTDAQHNIAQPFIEYELTSAAFI